jgi:crotonobetainyl-CoA:carnitine CoA-transferase CaiB-like acyl-CoA transferase
MTALAGLRVLDLTRLLPGPYCTQLLGDLGADVVKIEEPGVGDPARDAGGGALFEQVNRNKRSVALNLKTEAGRAVFERLVDGADVLVEGFRPGVMDRLGLDYPHLSGLNPRLIYATLSGFGQAGPYRDRAGHDLNYVALAGLLGLNAPPAGAPLVPSVQVADLGGGLLAAVAILAAVVARTRTGRGQRVDCSLFEAALAWLPAVFASYSQLGRSPAPGEPMLSGGLPRYDVYRTSDGRYVALGALEAPFFEAFVERAGCRNVLSMDPDSQRAELRRVISARSRGEWLELIADVDTCFAPVNTLDEMLDDPQVQAASLVSALDDARFGRSPRLGIPCTLSDTPGSIRRPPPALGEHTSEILAEVGVGPEGLRDLAARGVV